MITSLNLPFTGLVSFCRFPICDDLSKLDADIAILGVPSDEGSPWYPGSRFAPRKIRELSLKYASHGETKSRGFFDPDTGQHYLEYEISNRRIWDCGDVDILHTNVQKTFANITAKVKAILRRGAIPVVIGGDHAISFPVVRAFKEPINLVQLDSHLDFREEYYGSTMTNGHPMRRISKLPNVGQIVQIGIRGLRINKIHWEDALRRGNKIITARQFHQIGITEVLKHVPKGGKTYVTVDIDVLDSFIVPGCASTEIGGLTYDELMRVLFGIAERTQLVGFDVVEVNPMLDVGSNITSLLAAQLIVEFIGRIVLHPEYLKRKGWA